MKRILLAAALAAQTIFVPLQAHAITAGDVLDKMPNEQQYGYISGALDMLAHELSKREQEQKATCVVEWYYRTEGSPAAVVAVFDNHKDLPAVAILRVLADRHCPDE